MVADMHWLRAVDKTLIELVESLNEAGLQTDWCCSGEPGHMLIRPTIQIRHNTSLADERSRIETVMARFGIADWWLLLNFAHGAYNTHGGEPTWIIMIPGRFDLQTALPVAYSAEYQTDDNIDPSWRETPYKTLQS